MTGKERFTEHLYQMEKSSFLLDIIRAHISVIMTTDAHSGSMLDACIIMGGVSSQYCDFILKMREKFPNHDLEMLSQEIYDRIFSRDYKSTARFQGFFEDYLTRWNIVRKKERDLRNGLLDKDEAISNFKHAYYVNFGVDIDITEQISKEPKEQKQEPEQTTEPEPDEDDGETAEEFNIRLVKEELLCQMFKDGAIDEKTAMKYIGDPHMCHGLFLKLVDIHTGGDEEESRIDSWSDTQKKEHQMEIVAKMVQNGAITFGTAFEYMNDNNDFRDLDEFTRILDIWIEKQEVKKDDEQDD